MKLAFCLFKYFPYGGLQRDFLRIAEECIRRGHTVTVYCMSWEGYCPPDLIVKLVRTRGLQNHSRCKSFVKRVHPQLTRENYDRIIGFNKMPGLDFYYAADTCYQARVRAKHKEWWYRWLPRYHQWIAYEKAVFGIQKHTHILLIAKAQQTVFARYYGTQPERFHLLPPGIAKDRIAPENALEVREAARKEFGFTPNEFLVLFVGSGFKTKGLDRALLGLAALPKELRDTTKLWVVGKDNQDLFVQKAHNLGLDNQVTFLGGRDDIPRLMLAADLLVHPAYHENTGTVLLEAIVSGLPVLTTDVCGYANYVLQAEAGIVLHTPFKQDEFNQSLQDMLLSFSKRKQWQQNGIAFAKKADLYSMPERAVDMIELLQC